MSVSDGQPVNASVTNNAYMSRLVDTSTVGKVDLQNISHTDLINLQRIVNEMLASLGVANQAATDAAADTYSSNNVVTNGDNRKAAIGKLDERFNGTTGHSHDGTNGEGSQISASNLSDFNNLFAEFGEYTFDAASGTSIDVTSLFSGQSSGGDASTEGVITSAPNNYLPIVEKTTGGEIEDAQGDRVYGRLTESGGTWTLSFYTNEAGTETAHSLASQDIRFLYREVFTAANRPTIGANVAVYDTQSAIGDIPDASASQRGVVSTGAQTFAGAKDFTSRPTVNAVDVVDISASQVITNKDIDGGTASNTSRITLPKNTTAALTGLTRKEGTVFYDTTEQNFFGDNGTDIIPLGGGAGAGGGLDVWHTENFEDTVAGDFSSGNNATFGVAGTFSGTLADETVSPIASTSSLKYTQTAGSLNDWFKSPVINIDNKQSGNTSGITLYFTYTGDPGDIQFVFYDETGAAVLTASEDTFTTQSNPTRYSTSVSIPSATTSVSWGAHVKVENIGAVLVVDDVEFSTNPFTIQNIVERQQQEFLGDSSTMTSRAAGSDLRWGTLTNVGQDIISYDDSNGRFIALRDCEVNLAWSGLSGTTVGFDIRRNGTVIVRSSAPANTETFCSTTVNLVAGDYLTMRTAIVLTGQATLQLVAETSSPHVVTPAKVLKQYTEAAGDFTVTGTNSWTTVAARAIYYQTSDGAHRVKFNFTGTIAAAAGSTLTWSGVTFKNIANDFQAVTVSDTTGTNLQAGYVQPGIGNIEVQFSAATGRALVSGDVELDSKPTWADPVSSNFLAAIPEDLGVKPALYVQSSGQTLASGVEAKLNFQSLETDQDSLVTNPSSDWKYIAPKDGVYEINAAMLLLSAPMQSNDAAFMRAYVNGSPSGKYINLIRYTATLTSNYYLYGSLKLELSKGDEVEIYGYQANTGASNVNTNPGDTFVSITREQTPVSFGGDIRQESVVLDATGSNNFTGGDVRVTRIGNQVTISLDNQLTFASSATPSSASGFIPSWARPSSPKANVGYLDGARLIFFQCLADGTLQLDIRDWAGASSNLTISTSNPTLSYNVE